MSRLSRFALPLGAAGIVLLGILGYVSCGGSGTTLSSNGTVNTSITDPPWCSVDFEGVWVTVTKVTANINANAGPNDSGWQTLVDLTSAPKQINLLALAGGGSVQPTCLLTMLGSTTLPPGTYQQIRLYLLSNTPGSGVAVPGSNACSPLSAWNCVVPKDAQGNPMPPEILNLSSESQTGIKIPSSQIDKGGLTVQTGQAVDLNIFFGTCESLVREGNGQWRLKPVLHAGEVTTTTQAISGTVIDASSKAPIPGANVILEVPDPNDSTVDIPSGFGAMTDANGNFSFCPITGGPYDVVVTAQAGSNTTLVTYNATVTLNVPVGSALGNIAMYAEGTTVPSLPAVIQGQVTSTANTATTGATAAQATSADITLATLQAAGSKAVTILPFSGSATFATVATPTVTGSGLSTTCPTGTKCENYVLGVPGSNPSVATFAAGTVTTYPAPAANPALYWVRATATLPGSSSTPPASDCTPSVIPTTLTAGVSPTGNQVDVTTTPPATQNFGFVSCTSGL